MPRHGPEARKLKRHLSIKIDPQGDVHCELVKTLYGLYAHHARRELADLKAPKRKEELKKELAHLDADVKVESVNVENLRDTEKPLKKVFRYRVNNAVALGDGQAVLRGAGFFWSRSQSKRTAKEKTKKKGKSKARSRTRPLVNYAARMFEEKIVLTLPEGWTLKKKFSAKEFKNEAGQRTCDYEMEKPNVFWGRERWIMHRFDLPAEKHQILEAFLSKKRQSMFSDLVFETP